MRLFEQSVITEMFEDTIGERQSRMQRSNNFGCGILIFVVAVPTVARCDSVADRDSHVAHQIVLYQDM